MILHTSSCISHFYSLSHSPSVICERPCLNHASVISVTPDLMPLAVVDLRSTAGHSTHGSILQLQLHLPMMHHQNNPRAVQVAPSEEDHALGVVGPEVKLCRESERKPDATVTLMYLSELDWYSFIRLYPFWDVGLIFSSCTAKIGLSYLIKISKNVVLKKIFSLVSLCVCVGGGKLGEFCIKQVKLYRPVGYNFTCFMLNSPPPPSRKQG